VASELGLTGPAARACGLERDARSRHPTGIFRSRQVPVAVAESGDVFARAWVRWLEVQRSIDFLRRELAALGGERPALGRMADLGPRPGDDSASLAPRHLAVALVEGWRGEICHVALTDERGRFARYKIVDPSFHNWSGLAYAMRGQQISDFPLCNKSFNLSYCGHDL
jgi:Ni,Fe-hydrogenase III large subunit